jgi:hypothetical protein
MGGGRAARFKSARASEIVASLALLMLHMSVSWSDKPPIGHGSRKQPTRAKARLAAAPFQIPGAIFTRRRLSSGFSSRGAPAILPRTDLTSAPHRALSVIR